MPFIDIRRKINSHATAKNFSCRNSPRAKRSKNPAASVARTPPSAGASAKNPEIPKKVPSTAIKMQLHFLLTASTLHYKVRP